MLHSNTHMIHFEHSSITGGYQQLSDDTQQARTNQALSITTSSMTQICEAMEAFASALSPLLMSYCLRNQTDGLIPEAVAHKQRWQHRTGFHSSACRAGGADDGLLTAAAHRLTTQLRPQGPCICCQTVAGRVLAAARLPTVCCSASLALPMLTVSSVAHLKAYLRVQVTRSKDSRQRQTKQHELCSNAGDQQQASRNSISACCWFQGSCVVQRVLHACTCCAGEAPLTLRAPKTSCTFHSYRFD